MSDNKHLVFVHGTLTDGSPDSHILYKSEYVGPGVTKDLYSMFLFGNNLTMVTDSIERTPIHGELYRVADCTMHILDTLYAHPNFYERRIVLVNIPGINTFDAYMYVSSSNNPFLKTAKEVLNGDIRSPQY